MRSRNVAFIVILSLVLSPVAWTQATPKIKEVPMQPTNPIDGAAMYQAYCAVCHGPTGKGDGPAAAALKVIPGNLTMLAQRNNGKFPGDRVRAMIEGRIGVTAHGTREMPMWGNLFRQMGPGDMTAYVHMRIHNLTKYVETLQAR